jgi:predicted lipoprotein
MAAKYQLITELYRRTGVAVAKNPQAWQGFLSSACRNYKCRFDEQLLIYAQRPDAVVGSIRTARVLPYLTRKVAGIR